MQRFQNGTSLRHAARRVEILCSADDKTVCRLCVPRRSTHTLPGRSLLPSGPAVSRYTPPCDVADAHTKSATFRQPTDMELSQFSSFTCRCTPIVAQHIKFRCAAHCYANRNHSTEYVQICHTELQPNQSRNTDVM